MVASSLLEKAWYDGSRWVHILRPVSWLFTRLAARRRERLSEEAQAAGVPVVIVGNISVGGTGKTPLIIALVKRLQQEGYRPGVISRGYGGRAPSYPLMVERDTPVAHSGDEPAAIARATGCPVCVSPDRVLAAKELNVKGCDVILSDDGLQHYRLARDLEIAVVDGERAFGNGLCLPAGPLREPIERLNSVDWVIVNGELENVKCQTVDIDTPMHVMRVEPDAWHAVADEQEQPLSIFQPGQPVHAVAGIGHPERFFQTLADMGLNPHCHRFPDHYAYRPKDLNLKPSLPLVMTAKDAVKCQPFAEHNWWYLSVSAALSDAFWETFLPRVNALVQHSTRTPNP